MARLAGRPRTIAAAISKAASEISFAEETAHPKHATVLVALFVAARRVSISHADIVAGRGRAATESRHKFRVARACCVLKDAASENRAERLA
jgi:hypothetical protein